MLTRRVGLIGVAFGLLTACSSFGVRDAAARIASSQQCEAIELSVHESAAGRYEAVGCGQTGVWQCDGDQCSSGAEGEVSPAIAGAEAAAAAVEAAVLECSGGQPVTVQWLVGPDGRPDVDSFEMIGLDDGSQLCAKQAIWSGFSAPESRGVLISHAFGSPPAEVAAPVEEVAPVAESEGSEESVVDETTTGVDEGSPQVP